MSLRFHEIAESQHRIQNPLSAAKLQRLGERCQLYKGMRVLDLACGKGELLSQWAQQWGIFGVGIDISSVFIQAARERSFEMDVSGQITWIVGDAADFPQEHHQFDLVSCMGATWIGGGLLGTLRLMTTALNTQGGLLLVGEPYWRETPPDEAWAALNVTSTTFASLQGTLDRFETNGLVLIDMILADENDWDEYEARQWSTVYQWLLENADDAVGPALREWIALNRRTYLTYGRRYMGWGAFLLAADEAALRQASPAVVAAAPGVESPSRPVEVTLADGRVWVTLADGRVIGNPLAWYPWLMAAAEGDQQAYEMDMFGVAWRSLNQRIDISAMLAEHP